MADLRRELKDRKGKLAALKSNQSKANCSTTNSSAADMQREMQIEELEDEIRRLEKQLKR